MCLATSHVQVHVMPLPQYTLQTLMSQLSSSGRTYTLHVTSVTAGSLHAGFLPQEGAARNGCCSHRCHQKPQHGGLQVGSGIHLTALHCKNFSERNVEFFEKLGGVPSFSLMSNPTWQRSLEKDGYPNQGSELIVAILKETTKIPTKEIILYKVFIRCKNGSYSIETPTENDIHHKKTQPDAHRVKKELVFLRRKWLQCCEQMPHYLQ